jgi:integrase
MACITMKKGRVVIDFYDQHGRRRLKTLKKGITKKDAKTELRKVEEEIEKGIFIPKNKVPRFSEVAEEWLEYKKPNLRETSWENCEGQIKKHFEDLKGLKINSIQINTVEKFIRSKQEQGMNINTLRKILVTLGQILSYSVRHRYIDSNPLKEAERPKDTREEEKEMKILTPEEIRSFLSNVNELKYKTLFLLAIMSGAREGELLGLKWSDVDFENKQVNIQRTYTKGRWFPTKTKSSKRKIDLAPSVISELRKWKLACIPNDLDLVFPNEAGQPMNYSNMVNRYFEPALEKAGIIEIETIEKKIEGTTKVKKLKKVKGHKIRFHDLRHTYASLMIEQGENIKYIQTQLGHSSPTVTLNVYAHLMKPTNQEAVLRLENTIFEPTGDKMETKAETK